MHCAIIDWEVSGYEALTLSLELPDPDDRHVLAAAISCGADTIITTNLKHFPPGLLSPFGIEPQHPDDFVACQLDLGEQKVISSFKKQRLSLKRPPMSVEEFLESLARSEMAQTVDRLRAWNELI